MLGSKWDINGCENTLCQTELSFLPRGKFNKQTFALIIVVGVVAVGKKEDIFLIPQGKTHTLKPGAKDHVPAMVKGPPAQPMEDISMRIYLCEGLLGRR